jgi:hypothetical protein
MIFHALKERHPICALICSFIFVLFCRAVSSADADKIFRENSKAVVVIVTYDSQGNAAGIGSGFIVRSDGAVVTNYHVIGNAKDIRIKVGSKVLGVEGFLYIDKENDLVILKADGKDLPTLKIGDAAKVSVGEKIYVIGSPEGLENTISDGVVRRIRDITPERKVLQITAPISAGSSGGPVFNQRSEVIGIATFIMEEAQTQNFAMPANLIKDNIGRGKVIAVKGAEIEDYRKTGEYWFYLGVVYGEAGMYREAMRAYKEAIRIKPGMAEAHYSLGGIYGNSGMGREAIEAYKQVIRIKPDMAEAHYNLGVLYGNSGMVKEAIEAYKQAIRIKPDMTEAHYDLGVIYLVLKDRSLALERYRILKDLDPEEANKFFNLIYESVPSP